MRLPSRPAFAGVLSTVAILLAGATAVTAEDVVYVFRSGGLDVFRGTITEGLADGSIRFVTTEGDEHVFREDAIANVIRGAKSPTLSADASGVDAPALGERHGRHRLPVAFHGWVGWGGQALSDVNRTFEEDEELFASLGIPTTFERFGSALDLGGGLTFPFSNGISLGAEVGYQGSGVRNRHEDASRFIVADIALRVIDVTLAAEYRLPRGLRLGGTAGVALGHAGQQVDYRDLTDPANDSSSHSSWGGAGFSGGAFAGYERMLGGRTSVYLRTGYRVRNLGHFDGRTDSNELSGPSKPVDNAGNDVAFDFSGAYARVGVAFVAGR